VACGMSGQRGSFPDRILSAVHLRCVPMRQMLGLPNNEINPTRFARGLSHRRSPDEHRPDQPRSMPPRISPCRRRASGLTHHHLEVCALPRLLEDRAKYAQVGCDLRIIHGEEQIVVGMVRPSMDP